MVEPLSIGVGFEGIRMLIEKLRAQKAENARELANDIDRQLLALERHVFQLEMETQRLRDAIAERDAVVWIHVAGHSLPARKDNPNAPLCPVCHAKGKAVHLGPVEQDGLMYCPDRLGCRVYVEARPRASGRISNANGLEELNGADD